MSDLRTMFDYFHLFWLETVSEDMFQDNEEMVERDVIGVELPTELQAGLDHLLDHQLQDVDQVTLLDPNGIAI